MTTILYWFVLKTLKIYLAAIDPQYSVYSVHCTVVNTNSKYKEDDFTDSNAVAFSQDVFIYFLHEAPTCQTPLIRSRLTPLHIPALSQVRRVGLVTAPTQPLDSFMLMMQILS